MGSGAHTPTHTPDTHTHTHTNAHTCTHANTHTHTYTHTHTRIHTHMHTHMRTHTHTHIHSLSRLDSVLAQHPEIDAWYKDMRGQKDLSRRASWPASEEWLSWQRIMDVINNEELNFLKPRCAEILGVPVADFQQQIRIPDPVESNKHPSARKQLIAKLMHLFCAASAARCAFCLRPLTDGTIDADFDHLVSLPARWAGSAKYRKPKGYYGNPSHAMQNLEEHYSHVKYTRASHHKCNMAAAGTGAAH